MRRAAKRDRVEVEIVRLLRASGFSVEFLNSPSGGVPDLVVGKDGRERFIEVKTGKAALEPSQVIWHSAWRGSKPVIVRSVDDAHEFIQGWPKG